MKRREEDESFEKVIDGLHDTVDKLKNNGKSVQKFCKRCHQSCESCNGPESQDCQNASVLFIPVRKETYSTFNNNINVLLIAILLLIAICILLKSGIKWYKTTHNKVPLERQRDRAFSGISYNPIKQESEEANAMKPAISEDEFDELES